LLTCLFCLNLCVQKYFEFKKNKSVFCQPLLNNLNYFVFIVFYAFLSLLCPYETYLTKERRRFFNRRP